MRQPARFRRLVTQLAVASLLVAGSGTAPALRGGASLASAEPASPPLKKPRTATAAATHRPGAVASSEPAPEAPLATFADGEIRVRDWRSAFAARLPQEQRALAEPAGRAQLLRDLERYALLIKEAERRGYAHHVAVEAAAEKAAIDALTTHELVIDPDSIPDADVAAEYAAKQAQYQRPALRRSSQIVVAREQDAKNLLHELRGATREEFGKVARERSIDEATRKQSGELGWFSREGRGPDGRPVPVPAELVAMTYALPRLLALSPQPVRVANGFALLQLTGEDAALEQSLTDAAGEIREQIAARRSLQRVEELVAQLRTSTPISVHPELLDAIAIDSTVPLDIPQGFPPYPPDPRVGPKRIKPDKY